MIDPMCGSGAIPVEGVLEWPDSFHIGGKDVLCILFFSSMYVFLCLYSA